MSDFYIDVEKEIHDIGRLCGILEQDDWIDRDTVIVVCSPEYSSIICQIVSHNLSHLRGHVPLDLDFLEMPYPGQQGLTNQAYEQLIRNFAQKYRNVIRKLLFIDSGVLRGQNYTTLKRIMKEQVASHLTKYACLYRQDDSIFKPDYCVEEFNFERDGGLTFWWENPNNPYWGW